MHILNNESPPRTGILDLLVPLTRQVSEMFEIETVKSRLFHDIPTVVLAWKLLQVILKSSPCAVKKTLTKILQFDVFQRIHKNKINQFLLELLNILMARKIKGDARQWASKRDDTTRTAGWRTADNRAVNYKLLNGIARRRRRTRVL